MATTTKQEKAQETFDNFESILDYVAELVKAYPKTLSHQELAEKVGVTPPSVSKVKDRLFGLCNHDIYGLQRRFILSDNMETAFSLFFQFMFRNQLGIFVSSEYFRAVIAKSGIHESICAKSKTYSDYFSKEDTAYIISVILENLTSLKDISWNFIEEKDEEEFQYALFADIAKNFSPLFSNLRVELRTEQDLIRFLTLRDKVYYFAWKMISEWAVNSEAARLLKNRPEEQAANVKGFLYFIKHYGDRAMREVNKTIRSWVKPSLNYPADYDQIGRFFKPSA